MNGSRLVAAFLDVAMVAGVWTMGLVPAAATTEPVEEPWQWRQRTQALRPLPGRLDRTLVFNDNNPESITASGILLSTFPAEGYRYPEAHLDQVFKGPFAVFSHHVYARKPEAPATAWIALLARNRSDRAVQITLQQGATYLSQPDAPFLPLPSLLEENLGVSTTDQQQQPEPGKSSSDPGHPLPSPVTSARLDEESLRRGLAGSGAIYAGPGSRVAGVLLDGSSSAGLPSGWALPPGAVRSLLVLPIPTTDLKPEINGRNLQLYLHSTGPVSLASVAVLHDQPPDPVMLKQILDGPLSPKDHRASPPGGDGPIVYSRVSGVQRGVRWYGRLTDPGRSFVSVRSAPLGWPISALAGGTMATGQVQTGTLQRFYPGTAWAAHGNYGVTYDLVLPLLNDTSEFVQLQLALESPLEREPTGETLNFRVPPARQVSFRGVIAVAGLDGEGEANRWRRFHLVQRRGQPGPLLGNVSLQPGEQRNLRVRLIYPADATPPQLLSLLRRNTIAPEPNNGDPRQLDVEALIRPLLEQSLHCTNQMCGTQTVQGKGYGRIQHSRDFPIP